MPLIYHLAQDHQWREAQAAGEYRISTLGRTLAEVGFIHCSSAAQVAHAANRYYRETTGLLLLTIDADRLRAPLRYDAVPDADEPYPHVYGPLNIDAVVRVEPYAAGPDGAFPPVTGPAG
jgi:glutathione S-transferase